MGVTEKPESGDPGNEAIRDNAPASYFQLEFSRHAMACPFQVLLNRQHVSSGPEWAVRALDRISRLEQRLSIYLPESDLSRLNREGSQNPVSVSPETYQLLQLAMEFHRWTGGAFDIASAALSHAWGFSRRCGRMPSNDEILAALQACGSESVRLLPSQQVAFDRPGIQVNPGGIGKGFALDRAAEILNEGGLSDFLIHGGKSSAIAFGSQSGFDGQGWRVAVRHPYQVDRLLGEIHLLNQSLGTSGAANQFFYFQGKRFGHVIDPRTGWPAQNWLSTTVIAPSAAVSDAIATATFVMDRDEIDRFAATHPEIGIIAVGAGKREGDTEVLDWNLDEPTWFKV